MRELLHIVPERVSGAWAILRTALGHACSHDVSL